VGFRMRKSTFRLRLGVKGVLRMRKTPFTPRRRRNVDFRMRNPTERPPKHLKVCDVFWRILVAKIRLS
jgi:hypothetical protein